MSINKTGELKTITLNQSLLQTSFVSMSRVWHTISQHSSWLVHWPHLMNTSLWQFTVH